MSQTVVRTSQGVVLRRICGVKRDEVAGEWKKLRSEIYLISS
jgi:hypothetical protein